MRVIIMIKDITINPLCFVDYYFCTLYLINLLVSGGPSSSSHLSTSWWHGQCCDHATKWCWWQLRQQWSLHASPHGIEGGSSEGCRDTAWQQCRQIAENQGKFLRFWELWGWGWLPYTHLVYSKVCLLYLCHNEIDILEQLCLF